MTYPSLKERCLPVVEGLAHEQGWSLPPEGIETLVTSILPYVPDAPDPDVPLVCTIAANYYLDGPMVQAMLQPGAAGDRLWGEWWARFEGWAHWKGVRAGDIEDLTQEACIQAGKALSAFQFRSRLLTFFCSVFHNCYFQWLRSHRPEPGPGPDDAGGDGDGIQDTIPDQQPQPEEQVAWQERNAEIRELVRKVFETIVSHEDFLILRLYYGEEAYVDERTRKRRRWTDRLIAEQLGLTQSAVTSRRLRLMARLRKDARLAPLMRLIQE